MKTYRLGRIMAATGLAGAGLVGAAAFSWWNHEGDLLSDSAAMIVVLLFFFGGLFLAGLCHGWFFFFDRLSRRALKRAESTRALWLGLGGCSVSLLAAVGFLLYGDASDTGARTPILIVVSALVLGGLAVLEWTWAGGWLRALEGQAEAADGGGAAAR